MNFRTKIHIQTLKYTYTFTLTQKSNKILYREEEKKNCISQHFVLVFSTILAKKLNRKQKLKEKLYYWHNGKNDMQKSFIGQWRKRLVCLEKFFFSLFFLIFSL